MLTHNGFIIIFKYVLISNIVNIDKYNHINKSTLESSTNFKSIKGYWNQKV